MKNTAENQSPTSLPFEGKEQYTLEHTHRRENRSQAHRQALTRVGSLLPWTGPFLALFLTKKVVVSDEERYLNTFMHAEMRPYS